MVFKVLFSFQNNLRIATLISFLGIYGYSFSIDFNLDASANIDSRIAAKHTSVYKPIYSLQNHTNGIYTRNVNCWAADLDLTCVSPWNSRDGVLRAGTLITPRHCILAAHYNLKAGDSIRFVTNDNITIRRKIIAHKVNTDFNTNMPDLEVITLNADVPSSITPCQFLPSNYKSYIANDGDGLPVLYTDQEEKALVADIRNINSGQLFDLQVPTNSNRLALNESIISGDSGNPIFLILNGKPVIIGCFTWGVAGSGNALSYYGNLPDGGSQPNQSINDLIVAADAIAGINTGYKISYFDFSTASALQNSAIPPVNVVVKNRVLQVVVAESIANAQIIVYDALGKVIANQHIANNTFNFAFAKAGLYIVRVQNGNDVSIHKLFAK